MWGKIEAALNKEIRGPQWTLEPFSNGQNSSLLHEIQIACDLCQNHAKFWFHFSFGLLFIKTTMCNGSWEPESAWENWVVLLKLLYFSKVAAGQAQLANNNYYLGLLWCCSLSRCFHGLSIELLYFLLFRIDLKQTDSFWPWKIFTPLITTEDCSSDH